MTTVRLVGVGYLHGALKRMRGRIKRAVEKACREEMERMIRPNDTKRKAKRRTKETGQ